MAKRSSPWPWTVVALLWVVGLLHYLDRLLISSRREAVESSIPMSEPRFGLLASAFLWSYGRVSPLGGFCADRFSRRTVILASMFLWSVFTCLSGWAPRFRLLLLSCVGMVFGVRTRRPLAPQVDVAPPV